MKPASVCLPGPCGPVAGPVDVPASKSLTNRALIAAAVADGGRIRHPLDCDDTRHLSRALETAGWPVTWRDDVEVRRRSVPSEVPTLWLGDSGTGARLILSLMAASPGRCVVDGSPRLRERPMGALVDALVDLGARFDEHRRSLPFRITGSRLRGGPVTVAAGASSQFVSSLLLAAPLMAEGLTLTVDGRLPSRPYVELTIDTMEAFGIAVDHPPGSDTWRVAGGAPLPTTVTIEGDWSAAAFFAAAAAVAGGRVSVGPLRGTSRQGDRRVCDILERAGMTIGLDDERVWFEGPATRPVRADLRDCPDLFPALAVVAAAVPEGSELTGLEHLEHKESDRLGVMVDNLSRLGCRIEVDRARCRVAAGLGAPTPGSTPAVTAANDHRIAMAMAVAALRCGPLLLDDPTVVSKSFPDFWVTWDRLVGGSASRSGSP